MTEVFKEIPVDTDLIKSGLRNTLHSNMDIWQPPPPSKSTRFMNDPLGTNISKVERQSYLYTPWVCCRV